jgi:hypothetical protein
MGEAGYAHGGYNYNPRRGLVRREEGLMPRMRARGFKQRPGIYDNVPYETVLLNDLYEYVTKLRAQGESDDKIASRLDVKPSTVAYIAGMKQAA